MPKPNKSILDLKGSLGIDATHTTAFFKAEELREYVKEGFEKVKAEDLQFTGDLGTGEIQYLIGGTISQGGQEVCWSYELIKPYVRLFDELKYDYDIYLPTEPAEPGLLILLSETVGVAICPRVG